MALFGVARGRVADDWDLSLSETVTVNLEQWGNGAGVGTGWGSPSPAQSVKAYAGLDFTDTITQGSIVWMFYLFRTYFVVLTSC